MQVTSTLAAAHTCLLLDLLHALSRLPGDIDELDDLEVGLQDVDVLVEAAALAPLGHDGQVVLSHVAHKQQDVDMSRFPAANAEIERRSKKNKKTMEVPV